MEKEDQKESRGTDVKGEMEIKSSTALRSSGETEEAAGLG